MLFVLRMLRMSLSMVTLLFSAKYFGVSMERDVWILVTAFLTTICQAVWGPINETFRTKFVFIREQEGSEMAVAKTSSLLAFVVAITLVLSIAIFLFVDPLRSWLMTNSTTQSSRLFISLILIMLPTFLMNELISIGISVLNAYEVYYVPELVGAVTTPLNLLFIIVLAPVIGIYSLAVSQYAALLIMISVIAWKFRGLRVFHSQSFALIKWAHVRDFLLFALPFFFPYFVGQCNFLADKWLAGWLGEGNISSLDYARQFSMVLQGVLSSLLTTMMVPLLAKSFCADSKDGFLKIFEDNVTVCFTILSLAVPLLTGASQSLCEFFFLRGKVSADALQDITQLTCMFGFSFIGVMVYLLSGYALLASNQGKRYAFCGLLTQIIVLGLNFLFIRTFGLYIFPFSHGLTHLLSGVLMFCYLPVEGKRQLAFRLIRYTFVVCALSLLVYAFDSLRVIEHAFLRLLADSFVLLAGFLLLSRWLDLNAKEYALKFVNRLRKQNI